MLPYFVDSCKHWHLTVNISTAEVHFHVLPFPLFLILSIDIIIPTGINITSMWQPKRWYHCLFKRPLCFSPPWQQCHCVGHDEWKNPEGYWLQAMELVANKQRLVCIVMWWCKGAVQKIALSSAFKFQNFPPDLYQVINGKWLEAMQHRCLIIW